MKTRTVLAVLVALFALGAPAEARTSWSFHFGIVSPPPPPPRRIYRRTHVIVQAQTAGRWETIQRQVWVPGRYETRYVPAQTETLLIPGRYDRWGNYTPGRTEVRIIREAYQERYWVEGYYTTVSEQVWIPY